MLRNAGKVPQRAHFHNFSHWCHPSLNCRWGSADSASNSSYSSWSDVKSRSYVDRAKINPLVVCVFAADPSYNENPQEAAPVISISSRWQWRTQQAVDRVSTVYLHLRPRAVPPPLPFCHLKVSTRSLLDIFSHQEGWIYYEGNNLAVISSKKKKDQLPFLYSSSSINGCFFMLFVCLCVTFRAQMQTQSVTPPRSQENNTNVRGASQIYERCADGTKVAQHEEKNVIMNVTRRKTEEQKGPWTRWYRRKKFGKPCSFSNPLQQIFFFLFFN